MEAIFRYGGRQYKAKPGAILEIDRNAADAGSTLEFGEVLYVGEEGGSPRVGSPLVKGAKVVAKVVGEVKGPKLVVAYLRRRKNSRKKVGHRQRFTRVRIESIEV